MPNLAACMVLLKNDLGHLINDNILVTATTIAEGSGPHCSGILCIGEVKGTTLSGYLGTMMTKASSVSPTHPTVHVEYHIIMINYDGAVCSA